MTTTLAPADVDRLADHVLQAQTEAVAVPMLTVGHPAMTVADGYLVQSALRARILARGQRLVGWKAGLTSKAKMRQMGVDTPSVGFLTDGMTVAEGTSIPTAELVHPRVEPEVAFVLDRDLPTSGCTAQDVLDATAFVLPAIEVIDSRFEAFRFDLPSVVADNSSSSRFVLGSQGRRLDSLDRTTLGIALVCNGELLTTGASAAVMGDPAESVALVAGLVGSLGARIEAGMVVLSGGITEAFPVHAGDHVSARFQHLGVVDVSFA